jgi:uncharacterized protein YecT (DUF1311 family)
MICHFKYNLETLLFSVLFMFACNGVPSQQKEGVRHVQSQVSDSEENYSLIMREKECCLDNDTNFRTVDMNHCYMIAIEKLEIEMSNLLLQFQKILPNKLYITLNESQKEWLKYQSNHDDFIAELMGYREGTMHTTVMLSYRFDVLQKRVEVLTNLYAEASSIQEEGALNNLF